MTTKIAIIVLMLAGIAADAQEVITALRHRVSGGGGNTYTLVQQNGEDTVSGTPVTCTTGVCTVPGITATTAGHSIIACAGWTGSTITVSSVTDNATGGSNTYTIRSASLASNTTDNFASECADSLNTTHGGATTITFTFSANPGYAAIWYFEVSSTGSAVFGSASAVSNATGTGTTITGASVTTSGSSWFLGAATLVNSGPITGATSFSIGKIVAGGNASAYLLSSSAGTRTPVWTDTASADTYCASTVGYR